MKFQINDTVSVLDDAIDGIVIAVNPPEVTIETEDGFPLKLHESKLVKTGTETFTFSGIADAKAGKVEKKSEMQDSGYQPTSRDIPEDEDATNIFDK